jgi:hypothetical protein
MGDEFAVDDESMAAMLCMGEFEGSQQDYLSQEAVGMTDPAEGTLVTPALKVRQAAHSRYPALTLTSKQSARSKPVALKPKKRPL